MSELLLILLLLFVVLAVVVKVTEKHAKPLQPEQQQKLSRWLLPLIMVMLIAQLLNHWLGN